MRLSQFSPHWVGLAPGHAIGVTFLCPHCRECRLGILFDEPIGVEQLDTLIGASLRNGLIEVARKNDWKIWHRAGDTFETMSLTPSIDTSQHGHWHGFITNGEVS